MGPIHELLLPIPEGGGVVVLHGANGVGKTTGLDTVTSLVRGKGKLSANDDAAIGSVDGLGVHMTVSKSTRRSGELAVETLEGRLNIADLVDPKIASPEAADLKRLKALVGLQGVKADPTLYHKLAGGEEKFKKIVSKSTTETDDPVLLASRIQRDFHAAARQQENHSEHARGRADALKQSAEAVDRSAPSDATDLLQKLEAAIADYGGVQQQRQAADEAQRLADEAQQAIKTAQAQYEGPSYVQASAADKQAAEMWAAATERQRLAQDALDAAVIESAKAQAVSKRMGEQRHAALQHKNAMEGWQETIDKQQALRAEDPSDESLFAAEDAVTRAREELEEGRLVREAVIQQQQAADCTAQAATYQAEADRLRGAAHQADDILSGLIQCDFLTVKQGRLVTPTDRGEDTLFAELSDGERWKLALKIAVATVGRGGLIPITQEAWQALDHENRLLIAREAERLEVVVLTAIADSGPLRAEQFHGAA